MPVLNLSPDELLTTTRSVRKRLDFSRPVEPEVIRECLELAVQAPTGGNRQTWHFVVVTDAQQRQACSVHHLSQCTIDSRGMRETGLKSVPSV
jgi:nitroreductase